MPVSIVIKKQLAKQIKAAGGIRKLFNSNPGDQTLSKFLASDEKAYGERGSVLRSQVRNLLKSWDKYTTKKYYAILEGLRVVPFCQRYRDQSSDSDKESSSSESSSVSLGCRYPISMMDILIYLSILKLHLQFFL